MTRNDLKVIWEFPEDKLATMTCVELLSLESNIQQMNSAAGKVEQLANAHAAALAQRDESHKVALANQANAHADALATVTANRDALAAELAEAKSLIEHLGGTELGQQMRRAARKQQLEAQRQQLDAELAQFS